MKKNSIVICVGVLLLLVIFVQVFSSFNSIRDMDVYIFRDISECEKLESLDYKNAKIEYRERSDDKNFNSEMTIKSFYGAHFVSDELEFDIFAYEFEGNEDAKNYFKRATGKNVDLDRNYSASSGAFSFEVVVIDGNKAYIALASSKYTKELQNVLGEIFSVKLY